MSALQTNKVKRIKTCLIHSKKLYPDARIVINKKYRPYKNDFINQYLIEFTCPKHGIRTVVANTDLLKKLPTRRHLCLNCHTTHYLTRNATQVITDTNTILLKKYTKGNGPLVKCVSATHKGKEHIVTLLCPNHGRFSLVYTKLRDNKNWSCSECYKDHVASGAKQKPDSFNEALAKTIYTLAKGELYRGTWQHLYLKCPTHKRKFKVQPNNWVTQPFGCNLCRKESHKGIGPQRTPKEINKLVKHKNIKCLKYGGSTKLCKWKCLTCNNEWENSHSDVYVNGNAGCFKCNSGRSQGERELCDFIKSLVPDATNNHRIKVEGFPGKAKELDVYVPSKNIAFEYNGLMWHSTASMNTYGTSDIGQSLRNNITRHELKTNMCEAAGIRLIHVWEHDWILRRPVVESLIRNALGLSSKIVYGRKTKLKVVRDKSKVKSFYTKHHIQGAPVGGITLGLTYEGKFVAMMTFSSITSERGKVKAVGEYELVRFASSCSVVGGASKLLKCFVDVKQPNRIVSYSDRQYFTGNLYPTLGFKLVHKIKPDYKVIWRNAGKNIDVRHKSSTTRANLQKVFGKDFNPAETELQNSFRLGLHRFYDAGKLKWEWLNENPT